MAKIKQSPKLPAETRRNQLLTAAKTLFVKKGYRGTTIDEIARQAHLTKGAFYFYFKKKEDILLALVKSVAEVNRTALAEEARKGATPAQCLRLIIGLHCHGSAIDYGDLVDIWVQAWRIPRIRRYIVNHLKQAVDICARDMDTSGLPRGISKREMSVFIIGIVDGLSVMNMLMPKEVDLDRQVRLFEKLTRPTTGSYGKGGK